MFGVNVVPWITINCSGKYSIYSGKSNYYQFPLLLVVNLVPWTAFRKLVIAHSWSKPSADSLCEHPNSTSDMPRQQTCEDTRAWDVGGSFDNPFDLRSTCEHIFTYIYIYVCIHSHYYDMI